MLTPGGKLVVSDFVGAPLAMPVLRIGALLTKKATTDTLGPILPFETISGYHALSVSADITKNTLPSLPVSKKLINSYRTQSRVGDSMKMNRVKFSLMTFVKPSP